jgi:hypothetical protein
MISQVSFPGILRNDSHEASCTVRLFNLVTLPEENDFTYTRMAIEHVSKVLTDGDYVLLANGQRIGVRYCSGHWLAGSGL